MELTVVIPYFNGEAYIDRLLDSIPSRLHTIIIDDLSDDPYQNNSRNITVIRMKQKGYFTGACNEGIKHAKGDVLLVNQDAYFEGTKAFDLIAKNREQYGLIGEGIAGKHPAWKNGYIHGTFNFIRRDVIDAIGLMNQRDYPLWGSTCEYQLRACRAGFAALPVRPVPGFVHRRYNKFGSSIETLLRREPDRKKLLVRTPPEISIIATFYNYGKYAPDLVHSFIGGETSLGTFPQQSFASFELILVNDASTDNTLEILQSLQDRWKGVRVINIPNRLGTAAATNLGIRSSYGKFITVIGGDDMRAPGSLEALYRAQMDNPHSFIYDNIQTFGKGKYFDAGVGVSPYDFEKVLYKNMVHAGIMFPREAYNEVGGYPELMNDGREDWAMNIALGVKGYCGVFLRDIKGYLYRREKQNRTLQNTTPQHRQLFLAKLKQIFPEIYGGFRPDMCCGKPDKKQKAQINKSVKQARQETAREGEIILQYIGKSHGTQSFYGVETGKRYVAGLSHPLVAVDRRDLAGTQTRPGILAIMDGRVKLFQIWKPPVKKIMPTLPAQDISKLIEPEKIAEIEEGKPDEMPDIENMSLTEIKNLDLRFVNVSDLYEIECSGRNRKNVLKYLESLREV